MSEEKINVALLGLDTSLLSKVTKRINDSRPVRVRFFTDLKEFLEGCLQDYPDIVGISVCFPHKNITQFPKIVKHALNIPVIAFGENQQTRTRKDLSSSNADYKITGVLTAHNLWMKLLNFQKQQEEDASSLKKGSKKGNNTAVASSKESSKNNRGGAKPINDKSALNNLIAAMDNNGPIDSRRDVNFVTNLMSGDDDEEDKNGGKNYPYLKDSDNSNGSNEKKDDYWGDNYDDETFMGMSINDLEKLADDLVAQAKSETKDQPNTKDGNGIPNSYDPTGNNDPNVHFIQNGGPGENQQPGRESNEIQLTSKEDLKRKKQEREKVLEEAEFNKRLEVFKEACSDGLKKVFHSEDQKDWRDFANDRAILFVVIMNNVKGYLLISNSFHHDFGQQHLEDYRKYLIDHMRQHKVFLECSAPYEITVDTNFYVQTMKEFSNFTLCTEDENGKQIIANFVHRELVYPKFEKSEQKDMLNIDIKTIPPSTIVNFDAFLFLPKNKKYVRYLKNGRSLNLRQVKRISQDPKNSKLFLPKDQKKRFIKFFIQNTINWEIAVAENSRESA